MKIDKFTKFVIRNYELCILMIFSKKNIRFAMRLLLLCVVLSVLFFLGNVIAASLNSERMIDNVIASEQLLYEEGEYYAPVRICPGMMKKDNFTDALMLGAAGASAVDSSSVVVRAMENMCFYGEDEPKSETALGVLTGKVSVADAGSPYGRYWHGYLLTLKPMLSIFDLRGIRIVNYILLYSLLAFCLVLSYRRIAGFVSVALLVSMMAVGFPLVPDTLQYSTCFYISLIASATVLALPVRRLTGEWSLLFFFAVGAVTSYFDLLTTPLLTLGFPLTFLLLRRGSLPDNKVWLGSMVMWGLGYGVLWAVKWVLSSALTPYDMIGDAVNSIGIRTVGEDLHRQVNGLSFAVWLYCGLFLFAAAALGTVYAVGRKRIDGFSHRMRECFPFFVIAFLPLAWALVLKNHTLVHLWFVWRVFAITIADLMIFVWLAWRKSAPCKKY